MKKSNKQNTTREIFIGGGMVVFMTPLIILLCIGLIIAVYLGASTLNSDTLREQGALIIVVYTLFLLVIAWIYWKSIQRFGLILKHRHWLKQEKERVADMIDTSAAATRLSDQPITTAAHHVAEKHEHPSRDSQSG